MDPLRAVRILSLSAMALVTLSILTVAPISAQTWTPIPAFNAGNWSTCAYGLDGNLFAIYKTGAMYVSSDQGAHWTPVTPSGVQGFTAVLPLSGGFVYAGVILAGDNGQAMLQSFDGGATWSTAVPSIQTVVAFSQDPGSGSTYAATQYGQIWKLDAGTWTQTGTVPGVLPVVHEILADEPSPSTVTLFVASDAGFYSSVNDGSTWSSIDFGPGGPVLHLASDPADNQEYFCTANDTYQLNGDATKIVSGNAGALCTLSDGSLLINGLVHYNNGSLDYRPGFPGGAIGTRVVNAGGSTLFAATSSGVFKSSDAGTTWSDLTIARVPLTMIGGFGNSGAVAVVDGVPFVSASRGGAFQRIFTVPESPVVGVVATPTGGLLATQTSGVFQSDDGGGTWTVHQGDFSGGVIHSMTRSANGHVFVGLDGAIIRSLDDGVSWGPANGTNLTLPTINGLAWANGTLYACGPDGDIWASTDDADTWAHVTIEPLPTTQDRQLLAGSPGFLYQFAAGVLYVSKDSGADWSENRTGLQSVAVDNTGHLWVTTGGGPNNYPDVWTSADAGDNWTPEDSGTGISSLIVATSQDFYAGNSGGGLLSVFTCSNPGLVASWPAEGLANDVSGNNHNGVLQNGATFAAGKIGAAFSLDGVNDNVSVANSPAFSFSNAMSVVGWIKTAAGFDRYIATKHEDSFYFAVGGGSVAPHKLSFWLNGISPSWFAGSTTVDDGQWHHVAATYDGTTMRVYVDGHLDGSIARTGNIQTGTSGILIGARSDGTNASNFPGLIDELAVYNRALGPSEIQAIAAGNAPCAAVAVGNETSAARALEFSPPWPNPARQSMTFEFRTPGAASAWAEIIDVAGRLVSEPLKQQTLPGGIHRFQWDGRDAAGAPAAPGVYLVRVRSGNAAAIQRVVLLR